MTKESPRGVNQKRRSKAEIVAAIGRYESKNHDGREREGDPRLMAYMDALREGRVADCMSLRATYLEDEPLMRRFDTVEQIIGDLTMMYIREIQIQRREIRGWRNLADGYEVLADGATHEEKARANNMIKTGLGQLESALVLRKADEVVDVPNILEKTDEKV